MPTKRKTKISQKQQIILPLPSKPEPRGTPRTDYQNLYGKLNDETTRILSRNIQMGQIEGDSIAALRLPPLVRRKAEQQMSDSFYDYTRDYRKTLVNNHPRSRSNRFNAPMDTRKPMKSQYSIDGMGRLHSLNTVERGELQDGMNKIRDNTLFNEMNVDDVNNDGVIDPEELAMSKKSESGVTEAVEHNTALLALHRRDPELFSRVIKQPIIPNKNAYVQRTQVPLIQESVDSYYDSVNMLHPSDRN